LKKIILNLCFIFLSGLGYSSAFCQTPAYDLVKDTIRVNFENVYKISSFQIVPFTESIIIHKKVLIRSDYQINYSRGTFSISPDYKISMLDTIIISYRTVKLNLKKEYKRRSLVTLVDDKRRDTLRTMKKLDEAFTSESIFGKDIQKSGALIRGFTVGTNSDFTLTSGLRLQLSGKLSDDIELVAALTDENTPIQPEGNTETLQELDKVFIEIRHKNAVGTFGDYDLNIKDNEFSQVTRKLQGLKGEFMFGDTKGTIAVASSRGKFNTNQFNGMDGNQGPYRLYGVNNENAIILIAGSEQVYLDGVPMKRGENNDYTIDYANDELTFTPKRLITSVSRISVDFQYSDQNFNRNFFGADFSTKLIGDRLSVGVGYFRESDDENNPINASFTQDQLNILKLAGNNRNAAVVSGVQNAVPDSTGKITGTYSKIDTLINAQQFSYYKYAPGIVSSVYNVTFTYVGDGNGDYIKQSLGNYSFAGIKNGSYLPIIYLPMPEQKQLGNLSISGKIIDGVTLSAELSGSDWNQNELSTLDKGNDFGYARKILLDITPMEINIGGTSIGKIGLSLKDRFIQANYTSLDRINEVEFSRYYNLPARSQPQDQTLREFSLTYLSVKNLSINSKYGYVQQGSDFNSNRISTQVNYADGQKVKLDYNLDYVSSTNDSIKTSWLKETGSAFYSIGSFRPGIDFNYENREDKISPADTLLPTSLKYAEAAPFIEYSISSMLDAKASYSFRTESFPLGSIMAKQSDATTQQIQINFKGLKEFSSSLNMTFRDKKYTEDFRLKGYANNQTVLLLSQSKFNLWNGFVNGDLYYQAATEQTARLQKVFVPVPIGTGNYIYLGDLNHNGIQDEDEFQLTAYDGNYSLITIPTDKLYPVMDLKTNTRWKLDFSKIATGSSFLSQIIKPLSTETSWRVEENSTDENTKDIYLLHFSKFLNDSTTINGTQFFQHDINLFQNSNELSFRLRYDQKKSLNQFSGGDEKAYFSERTLRIRFKMIEEVGNQTDLTSQNDNLISPASLNQSREVSRNDFTTDFSYRPMRDIEVGFKISAGRSVDNYPVIPTTVNTNSVSLRINFSFENSGRLRLEMERTELTSSSNSYNIPFEVTQGNVIGKNYFWRAFFDYKLASFIQTSLSYDARIQGVSKVIQTMRAEARAYF
jgi:hypothetical protein